MYQVSSLDLYTYWLVLVLREKDTGNSGAPAISLEAFRKL